MDPQVNNYQSQNNVFHYKQSKGASNDLLQSAIIDLYISLKQKLRDHSKNKLNETGSINQQQLDEQEFSNQEDEKKRLSQLGNLVVLDYIRSSIDILLNLKFEDVVQEQKHGHSHRNNDSYINSSRGGHGNFNNENSISESQRSSCQSSISHGVEGPPKVYEEIIQSLEADVRKHIRIEQQLKLHIEGIEYRIDELENENGKLQSQAQEFNTIKTDMEEQIKKQQAQVDEIMAQMKKEVLEKETKFNFEFKQLQDQYQQHKDQLLTEIQRLQIECLNAKHNQSPVTPNNNSNSKEMCPSCKHYYKSQKNQNQQPLISQNQPVRQSRDIEIIQKTGSQKKRKDLSLEMEKRGSGKSNKKLFFKRTNISNCSCTCPLCLVQHQPLTATPGVNEAFQNNLIPSQQLSSTSHYKKMQKQFLERPLIPQSFSKDITKFSGQDRKQSASKKRNGTGVSSATNNNLNLSSLANSTPDKHNQNIQGLLTALNISTSSTQNQRSKITSSTAAPFSLSSNIQQQNVHCCQSVLNSTKKGTSIGGQNQTSYWTCQLEDNPYLQGTSNNNSSGASAMQVNLLGRTEANNSNTMKNSMLFEHSSTTSIQGDNRNFGGVSQVKTFHLPINQVVDQELSFKHNKQVMKTGLGSGNGFIEVMDFNQTDQQHIQTGANVSALVLAEEENNSDSILNSHRRSRSQRGSGKKVSKSERKSGRLQMMQFRKVANGSQVQNDILRSGTFQSSSKNADKSFNNDATPLKNLSNQVKQFSLNQQNVLSSEEKQKLFNTFMREMNNSMLIQNSGTKKKKKNSNNANELRVVSSSSSRPRSQLTMTNVIQQSSGAPSQVTQNIHSNINNNYSLMMQSNIPQKVRYKVTTQGNSSGNHSNQSRNNTIHKIKDFFMHNTYHSGVPGSNNLSQTNNGNNLNAQLIGLANQIVSQQRQSNQPSSKKHSQENYQFSPVKKK